MTAMMYIKTLGKICSSKTSSAFVNVSNYGYRRTLCIT